MRIAFRIQHLHGRDAPLERLLDRLSPAVTPEIVTDHELEAKGPNPMRNYLRCLEAPGEDVTHMTVLQDDCLPCKNFDITVLNAVAERPDDVISLFVGGLTNRTRKSFYEAMQKKERWCPVYFRDIHHVVGMVWPVGVAAGFLEWYATTRVPGPIPPRSDDAVVGYWARTTKHTVWATVPCLVEHPDDMPSTVHSIGRQGDAGRKAIWFED